jgi:sugar phosphate isomerase/epimerase
MLRTGVMEGVLKQPRERLFTIARELGFDGIEIEVRDDAELLRGWAADAGVPVSSLICGGEGAGDLDPNRRMAARNRLERAISDAAWLRVPGILWPMFDLTSLDDGAAVERFVEDVAVGARRAETAGVVIAWENALNAADTRALLEQVDSPCFRCYFDFANAAKRGADPVAEMDTLAGLIYQVHAKNIRKQHLDAPGVDLAGCLEELKRQGYAGWIVLETPSGADPLESARHNLQVLRNAWAAAPVHA